VDAYLRALESGGGVREEALKQRGSLSAEGAERLRAQASSLRESWR